jgi:hypothetical protein
MSGALAKVFSPRRRRWAKRFLIFLMTVIGVFAAYRYALGRIVAARLEAIRAAGYPVSLDELDQWYPQAPVSGNSAKVFGTAFAKLTRERSPAPLPRSDLAELSLQVERLSGDMKQAISTLLASNSEAMTLMHDGASIKRSRYPLDLSRLSLLPYPHLIQMQRAAYLLELEAIQYGDEQNPDLAVRSIRSLLGLADSLAGEPLVRSHVVRLECQKIVVQSLRSVLSKTALNDSDLSGLSAALSRADNPQSLVRAFAGQRCIGIYAFDMMAGSMDMSTLPSGGHRPWSQQLPIQLNLLLMSPEYLYYPSGLVLWDELRYLWFMDRYVAAAQEDFPERLATARALEISLQQLPKTFVLSGQWLRGINCTRLIRRDAEMVAWLRAARLATIVERYRLTHGEPPETLAALTSDYLKAAPADPFDSASAGLRYKKLAKGYVVYSVGQDGNDAGSDGKTGITFLVER